MHLEVNLLLIWIGSLVAYLLVGLGVVRWYAAFLVKNDLWKVEIASEKNQYMVPLTAIVWPLIPIFVWYYTAWTKVGNSKQFVRDLQERYVNENAGE